MLARIFTLATVLLALATQAQTNSSSPATDPAEMSLAEKAAAARKNTPSAGPTEMSLAEKAAAARKDTPSRAHVTDSSMDVPSLLTPEERGALRGSRYVNDRLHFQIELGNRWEPLTAERMALDEEIGRKYLSPQSGPARNRVLWVKDGTGCNFSASIVTLPPDAPTDVDQIADAAKQFAFSQLSQVPEIQGYAELVRLGDRTHRFGAFRLTFKVRSVSVMQSAQMTTTNGYLLLFLTTCRGDQTLSDALTSLKSSLTWTAAKP